jgi:hypothetical protein
MSRSTTYQIINKTPIPGPDLQSALIWLHAAVVAGGPPSGPAGGVLSGTYPNPGFAVAMATQADLTAAVGGINGQLAGKEPSIAPGLATDYWAGDKTWKPLTKVAVGLPDVDNTADADKPVSTATAAALAGKQDTLVSGTNIKTINGQNLLGSGDITISGGGGSTTVEDVLTSTSAVNALSANQGRVLKDLVDGKVSSVAGKGLSTEDYTTAEKTKLAGIAAGATANSTDAALRDRASHTGTQPISSVSGLQGALDAKQENLVSGSTLKTLNGVSLLGAGNITVSGGSGEVTTLALTYNSDGTVDTVTEDGVVKTLTYNSDGTVNTIFWDVAGGLVRTQTYTYSGGVLTGMTTTEV